MSSKSPANSSQCSCDAKGKHNSLSVAKKVQILQKPGRGISLEKLGDDYDVGTPRLYDFMKQKENKIKFFFLFADSDTSKFMSERKNFASSKDQ